MKEEAESIPSPASSDSGCGPQRESKVAEEAEPLSMKLGIGIGAPEIKQEKRCLTVEQQDEFQRQVLIYKYIAAGLPVPSALVRPMSKSVDDSIRFLNGAAGFQRQYPGFVGNPEPDRCRRTDGKKWRCKKNVIPGQKYCQQHMHRGRGRSRKPVEFSHTSNATPMDNLCKNLENSNTSSLFSSSATVPTDANIHQNYLAPTTATNSSKVDIKIMGANMNHGVVSCTKSISTSMIQKRTLGLTNAAATTATCTVHSDSTVTIATIGGGKGSGNNCYKSSSIDDRKRTCRSYDIFKNQIDQGNAYRNLNNASVCASHKLDFSPKSVLQVQGGTSGELEPGRCRRTDGKKWRCRRDVVPDEKYCKMHMHRGAKTRVLAYQPTSFHRSSPYATTSSGLNRHAMVLNNVDTSNLNTNLSISLTTNPQLHNKDNANTGGDGKITISSSSDTVSDTIVANCDYRDVTS